MEDGRNLAAPFPPWNWFHLTGVQFLYPARDFIVPLFLCRLIHGLIQAFEKRTSQGCASLGWKLERLFQYF